jgi:hypothetical protein
MAAEVLASNQCIRFLSVKALYTRANRDHNMQLKLQLIVPSNSSCVSVQSLLLLAVLSTTPQPVYIYILRITVS